MITFKEKDSCISKVLLRSNPRAVSSAHGSANHWRKNILLRSVLLPSQLLISPNWEFRAHSTSIRSVISDSVLLPLCLRTNPLFLQDPDCPPSLLLCVNYLWPQLYFPNFPQRMKPQPWLSDCLQLHAMMLRNAEKCWWAFTAGRNMPRRDDICC